MELSKQAYGVPELIKELLEDTKKEAISRVQQAEKNASVLLEQTSKEAELRYSSIMAESENTVTHEKNIAVAQLKRTERVKMLETKEEIIDAVFQQVREKLAAYAQSQEYPRFLTNLINHGTSLLKAKTVIIHVNREDNKRLTKKVIQDLETHTGTTIQKGDETIECSGGVILEDPQLHIQYDFTFENILNSGNRKYRALINKILFGDE